jgi:hypothetical protein
MHQRHGKLWPAEWLRHKGLPEWAEYWERTAMVMGPGVGDTHLLDATLPIDQTSREEVIWPAD